MRTQYTHGRGTHGKGKKKNPMSKAFMGAFPSYTPEQAEQMKMERVYGEGFQLPFDDDGQASEAELKKENLTGSQMKIAKQAAPFDSITGADFAAMKSAKENGMGSYRAKMAEYGRKMAMQGMRMMKEYTNGTGDPKKPGSSEFQAGQMVREGRGPSEEALTREMFAQQRLGFEGMPVAPTTKEGEVYESNPQTRKQVIEMRGRGHVGQGPSQQLEMKRMEYEDRMRQLEKEYADYFSRRSVVEPKRPEYSFTEGPGGEGGTVGIRGGASDIKRRTMGGRGRMYIR